MPPGDWISLRKTVNYGFNLQFYKDGIDKTKENEIYFNHLWSWNREEKLFIKSLYLNGNVAFIYYKEGDKNFYFELY